MKPEIVHIEGGITAAPGFRAGGVHCGIRRRKLDLALLVSDRPATVAGVFTTNKAQAAPVLANRIQLRQTETCQAVAVNSGVANACTGERGLEDAWQMIRQTAAALGLPEDQVLVSSTGVIGEYLPMEKITTGIAQLAPLLSPEGAHQAALAIMTTDTCSKEYAVRVRIGGVPVTIGAMAKGSGMIAPNMATMLAFIATDAAVTQPALQLMLGRACQLSFNRISVDGDTSTNDMAIVLANGMAQNLTVIEGTPEFDQLADALTHVMIVLAKMIARDGEGAQKLIEIQVRGAATEAEAEQAARAVANSNLVKTAIHGADANWGRILAAVGYSGIEFNPEQLSICLNGVPILGPGYQIVIDEEKAKRALEWEEVTILIDLFRGDHEVRFWTCDLTKEYVHINASYRS